MPNKKKCERKPRLIAAEEMKEVEGGACPKTWALSPWIFPERSIAGVRSMLGLQQGANPPGRRADRRRLRDRLQRER
jgi:hypothetical protein